MNQTTHLILLAIALPSACNVPQGGLHQAVLFSSMFCCLCHTDLSPIPCTCSKIPYLHAGHEFRSVGLTPCALDTAAADIGTKFTIAFTVSDSSSPPLQASVTRTVVVVPPCSSGMSFPHALRVYTLALILLHFVHAPHVCTVCSGHSFLGVPSRSMRSV